MAATDASGSLTYQSAYEAFGKHGDTASSEEWGSTDDRQQANTKDEDPTGLLNEGFSYRDLETGTFITRDPLGFVDGPNVYTYVVQNPWTFFDPQGLQSRKIDQKISNGYGVRVDQWNRGGDTGFQIHVYDKKGNEVGIVTDKGGYQRDHGGKPFNRPASSIPKDVRKDIRNIHAAETKRRNPSLSNRGARMISGAVMLSVIAGSMDTEANAQTMNALQLEITNYINLVESGNNQAADGKLIEISLLYGDLFGTDLAAKGALASLVRETENNNFDKNSADTSPHADSVDESARSDRGKMSTMEMGGKKYRLFENGDKEVYENDEWVPVEEKQGAWKDKEEEE